jgi:hypothetical protein
VWDQRTLTSLSLSKFGMDISLISVFKPKKCYFLP